jgi:hypothetical protein
MVRCAREETERDRPSWGDVGERKELGAAAAIGRLAGTQGRVCVICK